MRAFSSRLLLSLSLLAGCGGAVVEEGANEPVRNEWGDIIEEATPQEAAIPVFDALAFVRGYAAPRVRLFWRVEKTEAELTAAVRTTRDPAGKLAARRALFAFRFQAMEAATTPEERTRIGRLMAREERLLVRNQRDEAVLAEVAFAHIWLDFVAHDYEARGLAERFVAQYVGDRELLRIVTMVRAEIAIEHYELAAARETLSVLRGERNDPLTAYAAYRAASLMCRDGQHDACQREMDEARRLGCAPDAGDVTKEFAERAFRELGTSRPARNDRVNGRPTHCSRADVARYADPILRR